MHPSVVIVCTCDTLVLAFVCVQVSASLKFDHHVRQVVVSGSELVVEQASSASRWISVHPLFESKNNRPK